MKLRVFGLKIPDPLGERRIQLHNKLFSHPNNDCINIITIITSIMTIGFVSSRRAHAIKPTPMKQILPTSTARRTFLKTLCAGTLAATAIPAFANTSKNIHKFLPALPALPDEQYWELIKKQFTVSPNLIMMNAANLCPSPYFVQDEVTSLTKELGKDVSFQYRETLTKKRTAAMGLLAEYLGISGDEIAITRNTSESNNILVNGIDLKAGDEIVL